MSGDKHIVHLMIEGQIAQCKAELNQQLLHYTTDPFYLEDPESASKAARIRLIHERLLALIEELDPTL